MAQSQEQRAKLTANRSSWPPDQNQTQNPHYRLGLLYVSSKRLFPGTTVVSLLVLACRGPYLSSSVLFTVTSSLLRTVPGNRRYLLNKMNKLSQLTKVSNSDTEVPKYAS